MPRAEITLGEKYNICKYDNLDEGVEEVAPKLLHDEEVKKACDKLKKWRERLSALLDDREEYYDGSED